MSYSLLNSKCIILVFEYFRSNISLIITNLLVSPKIFNYLKEKQKILLYPCFLKEIHEIEIRSKKGIVQRLGGNNFKNIKKQLARA